MEIFGNVLHQLTNVTTIMEAVRQTLGQLDPAFSAEEEKYQKAAAALTLALGGESGAGVYLGALEEEFACAVVYIGWQGFRLNWEIFDHPVNALLLNGDYEGLCGERRLGAVSAADGARQIIHDFYESIRNCPEEIRLLVDEIADYYSYLRNTGYKIAHFFGFRLADQFLHYVVPGYTADTVNTNRYTMELSSYLQIDLSKVG